MNDASPAVHLLTFFLPSCYQSGCKACVLHGGADGGATLSGQLDPPALSCPFTHRPICEACATIIMLWLVSFSAMAYQGDTVQPLYTFQTFKNTSSLAEASMRYRGKTKISFPHRSKIPYMEGRIWSPRSLKSTTAATMVGGPKTFWVSKAATVQRAGRTKVPRGSKRTWWTKSSRNS